jgi:hypothetical protein
MTSLGQAFAARTIAEIARIALLLLGTVCLAPFARAQETPLLSGGVGFFTSTNGGNTSYLPVLSPVLVAPLGSRFQVEARAGLIEDFFPKGPGQGYTHSHFVDLSYLQMDYFATSHVTVVGGNFLIPFGSYNERLSPIWISNFQDAPYSVAIGTQAFGRATGGMLRGSAVSTPNYSVDYAVYFAAHVTNEHFQSPRMTGGKLEVYFPKLRLEIGTSYARLLETVQTDSYGAHLWWEPARVHFKFRSEYDHGAHADGYWLETDYRLARFGGPESLIGRLEPVFRWQQMFRRSPDPTDFLPTTSVQQADFGLDYHLPHEVRINTSYSREFTPVGNRNLWKTGIVYRFLLPAWK